MTIYDLDFNCIASIKFDMAAYKKSISKPRLLACLFDSAEIANVEVGIMKYSTTMHNKKFEIIYVVATEDIYIRNSCNNLRYANKDSTFEKIDMFDLINMFSDEPDEYQYIKDHLNINIMDYVISYMNLLGETKELIPNYMFL